MQSFKFQSLKMKLNLIVTLRIDREIIIENLTVPERDGFFFPKAKEQLTNEIALGIRTDKINNRNG